MVRSSNQVRRFIRVTTVMVLSGWLLGAMPVAAEKPAEVVSADEEQEEQYRFALAKRPVLQTHLGVGSGFQVGLGTERFWQWVSIPRGFVERGVGVEVISEWDRSGFKNISVLGRLRVLAAMMMPAGFGVDIFAGAATTGGDTKGIAGFSLHAGLIFFDYGYRYQRVVLPWSSPEWYGQQFFFVRFGFPIGK